MAGSGRHEGAEPHYDSALAVFRGRAVEEVLQLARWACAIEENYDQPMDIESKGAAASRDLKDLRSA